LINSWIFAQKFSTGVAVGLLVIKYQAFITQTFASLSWRLACFIFERKI
jgi:hypothetical protein